MVIPTDESHFDSYSQDEEPVVFNNAPPGIRLDRFLSENIESSREKIKESIIAGLTRVNGSIVKPSVKIKKGDFISFIPIPPPLSEAVPEDIDLDIKYFDNDIIVVNKSAGMVVHPAPGHDRGTLVNGLLGKGFFSCEKGDIRPGIVHRIDMDTSGLLVVARNDRAREHLVNLFRTHDIVREYTALVFGNLSTECGTFETLHGRNPGNRLMYSSRVKEGKKAITHWRVLERFGKEATSVSVRLETGRTHQIRVHFYDNDHPLLGDSVYNKKNNFTLALQGAKILGRQALHAGVLGFSHPTTGENLLFTSPLPDDMLNAIRFLRSNFPET